MSTIYACIVSVAACRHRNESSFPGCGMNLFAMVVCSRILLSPKGCLLIYKKFKKGDFAFIVFFVWDP